jgi:2-desacetyl-2-hydroxyethyl bacteriochlorophyllide A dehydrogenase
MKALVFDGPEQMHIGERQTPRPGPGEVQVRVGATGICAGDLYIYKGSNPYARYPVVGGHEIAGEVAEVGAGVSGLAPGQRVVVEPFVGCGRCYPCRIGKRNSCMTLTVIGVHCDGGFAEYVVAPAENIHRVPDGMSMVWASFAEPLAIGVQASRRGQIQAGEEVLVLGAGPIGLALIEVLRAYGAQVLIADLAPERLATAATLGAETLPAGPDLPAAIAARTGGEGLPVVIEATGSTRAMAQAVDLVASGGRIVILGLAKQGEPVSLPALDFTRKEMTVLGSRASVNCFPEALRLLASGVIRYPRVATTVPMWQAVETFALLGHNPTALHKGVLTID